MKERISYYALKKRDIGTLNITSIFNKNYDKIYNEILNNNKKNEKIKEIKTKNISNVTKNKHISIVNPLSLFDELKSNATQNTKTILINQIDEKNNQFRNEKMINNKISIKDNNKYKSLFNRNFNYGEKIKHSNKTLNEALTQNIQKYKTLNNKYSSSPKSFKSNTKFCVNKTYNYRNSLQNISYNSYRTFVKQKNGKIIRVNKIVNKQHLNNKNNSNEKNKRLLKKNDKNRNLHNEKKPNYKTQKVNKKEKKNIYPYNNGNKINLINKNKNFKYNLNNNSNPKNIILNNRNNININININLNLFQININFQQINIIYIIIIKNFFIKNIYIKKLKNKAIIFIIFFFLIFIPISRANIILEFRLKYFTVLNILNIFPISLFVNVDTDNIILNNFVFFGTI